MWLVSVICLSVVGLLCVVGTFHHRFDDNLGMRIGMGILGIGCAGRVVRLIETQSISPDALVMHVGMAMFALGLAWRYLPRPIAIHWSALPKE